MRAQQAADAGDPRFVWQVDGVSVVERYGREILGWKSVHFDDSISAAMLAGPGPLALQIDSCEPTETYACSESAFPIIERIVRKNETGVWTVRGIRRDTGRVAGAELDISSSPRPFLSEFFATRRMGRLADEYLTPKALADYKRPGDALALYRPRGRSFRAGRIVRVDRVERRTWIVEARISFGESRVSEVLTLGPGLHLDGIRGRLLVQRVKLLSA